MGRHRTLCSDFTENNRFILNRGADPKKDQSYFLWRLGQQELARTIFPLGDITKEEIKQYVEKKGFHEKVEKKRAWKFASYRETIGTFYVNNFLI